MSDSNDVCKSRKRGWLFCNISSSPEARGLLLRQGAAVACLQKSHTKSCIAVAGTIYLKIGIQTHTISLQIHTGQHLLDEADPAELQLQQLDSSQQFSPLQPAHDMNNLNMTLIRAVDPMLYLL